MRGRWRVWRLPLVAGAALVVVVAVAAAGCGVHLANLVGWDEPTELARRLEIGPGTTVADVGAGSGWLAVAMARRVGPDGRVFATEIDPARRDQIRAAVSGAGLANVAVIEAGERETGLPPRCCEVVYLRNVYHHLAAPEALNASLFEAVVPGGRLAIIDFGPGGWLDWFASGRPGSDGHGVRPATVVEEVERAGFSLVERDDRWGRHGYLLVFRRPPASARRGAAAIEPARSRRLGRRGGLTSAVARS